jgi:hypothetical protein
MTNISDFNISQNDETNEDIGVEDTVDNGESTMSSDIEEHDVDNLQEVLHRGQARWDKSLRITRVPPPKNLSHADSVIARPPLPNSRYLPTAMALPELKRPSHSSSTNYP